MNTINKWKDFLSNKEKKITLIITFIALLITLFLFSKYLLYIESREGTILDDPVFHYFNAVNLNSLIFILIYFSIILGLIHLTNYPLFFIIGIQSYILVVLFRIVSMFLVPLNPPLGTIDLQDPLVFVLGTGTKITKDLFFSGHTSTIFLIFLCARKKYLKVFFLILTIIIAFLLVIQKAHYSIDVLVAPFYSFVSYKIICYFHKVK